MREIERVGVLGAGTMGAGIVQVLVEAGVDTVVHDPVDGAVERARERIGLSSIVGTLDALHAVVPDGRYRVEPLLRATADRGGSLLETRS